MDANEDMSTANAEFSAGKQLTDRPLITSSLVWIVLSYAVLFILSTEQAGQLSREDGVVEYVGAALFLMASFSYLVLYKKSRKVLKVERIPLRGNVFYLLLGLAFLFVCLEEISWGQRIFGFETPERIREINSQSEFNFHNLDIFHGETDSGDRKSFWGLLLNMDRLFSMFWFTYCCVIPIFYRFSSMARSVLDKIRMPIVPMFLAAIFFLNYAITKALELVLDSEIHHSIVEIKETNIAMLFFVLAIWFLRDDDIPLSDTTATA